MPSTIHRRIATGAICTAAATLLLASAAQAACGTRQLGGTRGGHCSDSWGASRSRQQNGGAPDYNLGTVRGSGRRGNGASNPDLGNARRGRRWDRGHSLGRGGYKPY